jgi:hypothetical protein
MNKDVETIFNNYDNLSTLKIVKDLLNIVINDIEYMNDMENDYTNDFDLGNNTYIKRDDLESINSIVDTITDIVNYNEEEK